MCEKGGMSGMSSSSGTAHLPATEGGIVPQPTVRIHTGIRGGAGSELQGDPIGIEDFDHEESRVDVAH